MIVSAFPDPRQNRMLRRTLFGMDDFILERKLLSRVVRRAFRPAYNMMRGLAGASKKSGRLQKHRHDDTIQKEGEFGGFGRETWPALERLSEGVPCPLR